MRQRLLSQLTYANVISTVCLFLLLGGGTAVALSGLEHRVLGRHRQRPDL